MGSGQLKELSDYGIPLNVSDLRLVIEQITEASKKGKTFLKQFDGANEEEFMLREEIKKLMAESLSIQTEIEGCSAGPTLIELNKKYRGLQESIIKANNKLDKIIEKRWSAIEEFKRPLKSAASILDGLGEIVIDDESDQAQPEKQECDQQEAAAALGGLVSNQDAVGI